MERVKDCRLRPFTREGSEVHRGLSALPCQTWRRYVISSLGRRCKEAIERRDSDWEQDGFYSAKCALRFLRSSLRNNLPKYASAIIHAHHRSKLPEYFCGNANNH